jgi:hypothetical protein
LAAAACGGVAWAANVWLAAMGRGLAWQAFTLAASIAAGGAAYLTVTFLLRVGEARHLWGVARRLAGGAGRASIRSTRTPD